MSARDAMAAMLDELMGSKRNLDIGTDLTVTYDDPHICRYYIAGYCPHEMFVNTKADLGACPKIHDDRLRLEYPTSSSFEKMGFEQDFLRFLIRLEEDNQRRIKRNKEKLGHTDMMAQKREDERIAGIKTELALVEADIQRVMKATEEAGARNDVTTTLALVKQSEVLEQSKQALILKMETPPDIAFSIAPALAPMLQEAENRQKDVCDVCGSMLIRNDAQVRVEEHLMGKMHMGFAKIQVTIKELKERFRRQSEDKEKERDEKRKKREGERSFDRDRSDRRDRDRDRGSRGGRDHRHRSRSRDRRDRSRDRRSDHRRGDDRRNRR